MIEVEKNEKYDERVGGVVGTIIMDSQGLKDLDGYVNKSIASHCLRIINQLKRDIEGFVEHVDPKNDYETDFIEQLDELQSLIEIMGEAED
jgi:predicted RNA-binding protein with EMAP domain